jgi:uncharacterized protein involved in exopolysaccharide biosynthesis
MKEWKPENSEEPSSFDWVLYYVGILWRRKWLIIGTTLLFAVGSIAFSLYSLRVPPEESPLPNRYKANAVLLFQESGSGVGEMSSILTAFGIEDGGSEATAMSQLALQVLQSRSFLDRLVEEFNLIEKYNIEKYVRTTSRKIILDSSEYNYNRNTGIFTISFEHIDPVFAKDFVNREVELLQEWFIKEGGTTRSEQIGLMEQKMVEVEEKINALETEIRSFQQRYGVLDISEIARQQNAAIANLREQLVEVEMEIRNYEEYSQIEDPTLARLQASRNNILEMISEIEQGESGGDAKFPSKEQLPRIASRYSRMQLELEIQMGIYQQLTERYEIAQLSAAEGSLFKVLEWAEVPDKKFGPKRSKICMYATAFGFFIGVVFTFILRIMRQIKKDPEKRKLLKGEE